MGADVETTLYGDLPEDFWGETHAGAGRHDDAVDARAEQDHSRGAPRPPVDPELPEADAPDGAVPLFGSHTPGARTSTAIAALGSTEPPSEPEGERFGQLQALFPGRIIEVTRRERGAADEAGAVDEPGVVPAGEYDGSDDYAGAALDESTDEPRYDTAAEAAADTAAETDSEADARSAAEESR
jgi:hypothetical protein